MTAGRSHRTSIEILDDLLKAARKPVSKTRLMWTTGLNRHSFGEYLRFCTENDLALRTPAGYVTTPRGISMLEAMEAVLAKTNEFESIIHRYHGDASKDSATEGTSGGPLHYISRWAWSEIVLNGGRDPRVRRSGGLGRKSAREVVGREPPPELAPTRDSFHCQGSRLTETHRPASDRPADMDRRREAAGSKSGR